MRVEELRDPFERRAFTISLTQESAFTEVYGFVGRTGRVFLEGQLLLPAVRSDTVLLFMHPSSSLSLLPMPRALAEAGLHIMCCGSRYLRNDTALIMENVLVDLAAYVRYARETLGYAKVVLVGWSGGGSLSIYYQAQAERPNVTATPAGDPVDLSGLVPADAVLSVAAHLSRAETLTEWLDPSVIDELDPDLRDPEWDLYADHPRHVPPYDPAYVAAFREAQIGRSRRITAWAEAELARLKAIDNGEVERGFIVHRTMADPRWLDPAVDPNERRPGWCYLGNPKTANTAPAGIARYTGLRSWLSQWSYDRSLAKTGMNAPSITVPALVVENGADDATPPSHPRAIYEALGSNDKSFERIAGATHYYQEQPELQAKAIALCRDWLNARGMAVA